MRGFDCSNTLYGEATCPDEVNHDNPEEEISSLLSERYGKVALLGGLAGLPFVGQTGWNTFTSHVPNDGNIVFLYAPHVGLDNEG